MGEEQKKDPQDVNPYVHIELDPATGGLTIAGVRDPILALGMIEIGKAQFLAQVLGNSRPQQDQRIMVPRGVPNEHGIRNGPPGGMRRR